MGNLSERYSSEIPWRQIDQDKSSVKCPICGFHTSHMVALVKNENGKVTIDRGLLYVGPYLQVLNGGPTGRGSSVWLEFVGECLHAWAYRWQFHKGTTYFDIERRPDVYVDDEGPIFDLDGHFWRD